jgi:hypothetical protein
VVLLLRQVANILLAHTGREGGASAAALGIARAAARSWLGPLLDVACERLAHVIRNLFDLAIERSHAQECCDGKFFAYMTRSNYTR